MYGLPDTPSGRQYNSRQILEFLNDCIWLNLGPINTKLKEVPNLNMHFLTMWVWCCLSHNIWTRISPACLKLGNVHTREGVGGGGEGGYCPCILLNEINPDDVLTTFKAIKGLASRSTVFEKQQNHGSRRRDCFSLSSFGNLQIY